MEIKERFTTGMEHSDFLKILSTKLFNYQTNFERALVTEDDRAFFTGLGTFKVLVIAEPWCGDVVSILPVVARLLNNLENVEMRIFLRGKNPDLMDRYLTNGKKSVPKFVFFDEDFKELGVWGPRPAEAQKIFKEVAEKIKTGGMVRSGLAFIKIKEFYRQNCGKDAISEIKNLLK